MHFYLLLFYSQMMVILEIKELQLAIVIVGKIILQVVFTKSLPYSRSGFPDLTLVTLGQDILCYGDCWVHCRM